MVTRDDTKEGVERKTFNRIRARHEDNQATISQVMQDRLTPNVRHLGVLITWLHEHYNKGTFIPTYTKSTKMMADINTKPTGGTMLHNMVYSLIGVQYYPSPHTLHYKQLSDRKTLPLKIN